MIAIQENMESIHKDGTYELEKLSKVKKDIHFK